MPFRCKGVCDTHPDIYTTKKYRSKVGRDSFYCSICEKFVKIKNIIKNICLCCKARFRKKSVSDRQNKKYCKCGCGERINKFDSRGDERFYKQGHNFRNPKKEDRKCLKCDNYTNINPKTKKHIWHKIIIDTKILFKCHKCYEYDKRHKILII